MASDGCDQAVTTTAEQRSDQPFNDNNLLEEYSDQSNAKHDEISIDVLKKNIDAAAGEASPTFAAIHNKFLQIPSDSMLADEANSCAASDGEFFIHDNHFDASPSLEFSSDDQCTSTEHGMDQSVNDNKLSEH